MDIKELRDTINSNITFQRELIDHFILDCQIEEQVNLMKAIKDLKWSAILSIMDTYIKERVPSTVRDIIKRKDTVLFEYNHVNYQYVGLINGQPMFRTFGTDELITYPNDIDLPVTRLF